jgi:hypothetical protein
MLLSRGTLMSYKNDHGPVLTPHALSAPQLRNGESGTQQYLRNFHRGLSYLD